MHARGAGSSDCRTPAHRVRIASDTIPLHRVAHYKEVSRQWPSKARPQGSSRTSPDSPGGPARAGLRRVVAASMAGTIVEWYEFFLYATAADPGLQQDHVPAVGGPAHADHRRVRHLRGRIRRPPARRHRVRPLRRQVRPQEASAGRDHPRRRRRRSSWDCLPTYDQVGYLAPIAADRRSASSQGFAVGGEWGGAVLLVAEHSPDKPRGFWAIVAAGARFRSATCSRRSCC